MSAFTRSKIALLFLMATLAIAQPPREIEPQITSRVEPEFSNAPREPVLLRILVNSKGQATRITVMKPYDRAVDEAAIAAVQKWRFQPGTRNGMPVDSTLVVSFPAN